MESFREKMDLVRALPALFVSFLNERPRLSRVLLGVLLLIVFLYGLRVIKDDVNDNCIICPVSRSDFHDYYKAAAQLRAGKDPYNMELLRKFKNFRFEPGDFQKPKKLLELMAFRSIGSYLYPPFTAYVLQPITLLSYRAAAILFQILSIASLLAFVLVLRFHHKGGAIAFPVLVLLPLLAILRFCMENFSNGNIAFFLVFLCGTGLIFSWSRAKLVEFLGGLLLGVASIVKVTPAFFGLVIFAGRRWTAIAGMATGGVIALALPAATIGLEQNFKLLDDWRAFLLGSFQEIGFIRPWAHNQTISAAVGKLFIPFSDPAQSRFGLPFFFAQGIPDASKAFFAGLVRTMNLILYGFGAIVAVVLAYMRPRHGDGYFSDVSAARMTMLAVLISLVGSGVSWYHAYSILLVPLFARLYQHFVLNKTLVLPEKVTVSIIFIFGFGRLFFPSELRAFLSLYSVFAWLCVWVVFAHIYLLLVHRSSDIQ